VAFNRLVRTVLVASLALTGLTVSATASHADTAQPVEMPGTGHYYQLVTGSYTWNVARNMADGMSFGAMRGHLATVSSQSEQDFIHSTFNGATDVLIGGQNTGPIDGYARVLRWMDGPEYGQIFTQCTSSTYANSCTDVSYANWARGQSQPDGSGNYLMFNWNGNHEAWDDVNDSWQNDGHGGGFLVEFEPEPIHLSEGFTGLNGVTIGDKLFIPEDWRQGRVAVISKSNHSVDYWSTGDTSEVMVKSFRQHLYFLVTRRNSFTELQDVSPTDGSVLRSVKICDGPNKQGFDVVAYGSKLVADCENGEVVVVDASDFSIVASFDIEESTYTLGLAVQGDVLYVAGNNDHGAPGAIIEYDLRDYTRIRAITTISQPRDLFIYGNKLLVNGVFGAVIHNVITGSSTSISLTGQDYGAARDANGVWFSSQNQNGAVEHVSFQAERVDQRFVWPAPVVGAIPVGSSLWVVERPTDRTARLVVIPNISATNIDSPQNIRLRTRSEELTVAWDLILPVDSNATVRYSATTDSGGSCTTTSTSCDISGLTNGRSYSVTVTADDGTSTSVPSAAVTGMPVGPPTAPSITSVVAVNTQASLSLSAPSNIGDASLSGYDYSTNNGTSWSHFASASGPFVISGLTNGSTYQVKVRAVNSVGAGEASAALAVSPTKLIPAKPVIASVAAGNASATVSITKPTDLTSQSITGYQYSIDKGASYQPASVTDGKFTITGLTNGTVTTVQIRATNFNGNSLASVSKTVVPATTPSGPSISAITPSAGALSIAFTAPNNGGSAITGYQYSLDGGANWITPKTAVKKSPLKVTGLANATTYHVQLRAVNAMGTGTASSAVYATTPVLIPGAPVITLVGKGRTSLTVDVTAPLNTGGGTILNYASSTDGKTWVPVSPASNSTHIVINGLKANTLYAIRIAAINSAGQGAFASSAARTLQ